MNAKRAKQLRKKTFYSIDAKEFPTTYTRIVTKQIKHEVPVLNIDGTIDTTKPSTHHIEERITQILNPNCKRALYKEMKASYA